MELLYCKEIINHKIGDNTPFEEVAKSMGWTLTIKESDVEQAYDGSLWEKGYVPEKPLPTNEEQRQARADAYLKEIDPFHSQKQRRTILGTWTDADESEYIEKVKALSEDINNRYPYMENEQS